MLDRYIAYSLGPELAWGLVWLLTAWLVSLNKLPTRAGNQRLETIGYFLPLIGLLLAFLTLAWAVGSYWWLLLRIALGSAAGILVVISVLCGGIDYQDSRNSGVGTGFVLFIGLAYLELLIGLTVAVFFLVTNYSFIAFLKWTLIVVSVVACLWGLLVWVASLGEKKLP